MYDVVVVGAGVGGYPAAIYLARHGLKVAVIEEHLLGGECTNYGCVPSKALYNIAEAFRTIEKVGGNANIDWNNLSRWVSSVVKETRNGIEYLLESYGVDIINSKAVLKKDTAIKIGNDIISPKNIILALGTDPKPLPNVNFDGKYLLSNREVFYMEEKPEKILIIGGGVIGVEAAYTFSQLGIDVTIVEAMPNILPFLDKDISLTMKRFLREKNVKIYENTFVEKITIENNKVKAKLSNNNLIETDKILVAIGRKPKTTNIGLETVRVETTQKGFIKVNEKYQTTNPRIYAVGDVIGEPLLAHKAILESIAAARNILGEESFSLSYHLVPQTIFSGLEIAWIGYTERELREKGIKYRRIRMPVSHLSAVRIKDSKYSYVKILMDENNVPYGIFVVSPLASEVISSFIPFIMNKIRLEKAWRIPYPHLTVSETVREISEYILGEPIHLYLKK
ncbi:dihydrolipoamide dehydrogenase [Staphylothermus marinus F1]|uniref:Dihydrolipoyl dehydrogenase n=1 Tax=Staphylothermus marinus (strain ATCC 43588 / DSM 3639 / JCM 9404 / F1) TaxID=399550 RepID=A3DNK1_STAMF|nr:dihydrolipoyl dehydrogenase [Staphylothermus marinus]ABN70211.1 dihydrolipoamide dehydrogenase [Staphylothermus marinus F1]